ncbi:uncharacterized protein CELE_F46B6.10 [Caenorhabditis elegans]|uniref:Uncharacterized protein n=1 Tax=Caenorhabditis elegans TaxID=6239 RepID=Q20451_CAEEL|nr:Uncharacterized protein CELE_F46B6.10 [Caenorhabditis elegans]CAA94826.1 Uncharacterized protein CELE_F46B6.10 [Caenorhabditis elegans]|eukprot:NP_505529.1 Uncharacterized protein CELE_F46B6.10 [Caenorhabditis elegans]
MIIIIVISMLFAISCNSFLVFCAKLKKDKKATLEEVTPRGTTPLPQCSRQSRIVDRDDRGSTKTKGGRRGVKSSKEPDSTDDAFKEMAKRLAKKDKPEKTGDSIVGDDDENPLAQFQMPERPVVPPN